MTGHTQVATAVVTPAEVLLSLSGITKSFGAARALNGVDLDIAAGEVFGLMGDRRQASPTRTTNPAKRVRGSAVFRRLTASENLHHVGRFGPPGSPRKRTLQACGDLLEALPGPSFVGA